MIMIAVTLGSAGWFHMPGFNTGLCQCGSPKTLFRDSEQKEREKKRGRERSSGFTAAGPAHP